MKTMLKVLIGALFFAGMSNVGEASLLYQLLTSNARGNVDSLEDSSAGWFRSGSSGDKLTSGTLAINDLIQGVIRVDAINQGDGGAVLPVDGKEIYAVYSFKIASIVDVDGGSDVSKRWKQVKLVAAGDLMSSISSSTDGRGKTNLNSLGDSDVGVAILEKASAAPLAPTDINEITYFNDASWNLQQSYGFDTTDARDDYVITAKDGLFLPGGGTADVDLKDLDQLTTLNSTFGSGQTIADFDASFVLEGTVNIESQGLFNSSLGNSGDLIITDGTIKTTSSTNGHMFEDGGTFNGKFHGVPEPSTIAIWAALGLGGCGFVARRRMKAKKA